EPYRLTAVYNNKGERFLINTPDAVGLLLNYPIFKMDNNRIIMKTREDLIYNLPRIFSIGIQYRIHTDIMPNLEYISKKKLKKASESKNLFSDVPIPKALKQAKGFIDLISISRADEYNSWIQIGLALFTIGQGCSEALELWIDFSRKTTKNNF